MKFREREGKLELRWTCADCGKFYSWSFSSNEYAQKHTDRWMEHGEWYAVDSAGVKTTGLAVWDQDDLFKRLAIALNKHNCG